MIAKVRNHTRFLLLINRQTCPAARASQLGSYPVSSGSVPCASVWPSITGEKSKSTLIIAVGSLAENFLFSPVSSSGNFKIKVQSKQGGSLRRPYGLCPQIRWLEALPGNQMVACGCLFTGPPSLMPGVPDGQDWADTPEYQSLYPYQMPSGLLSPWLLFPWILWG